MTLAINGTRLDDPLRPYIIAEASGNHNQDKNTAYHLVEAAAASGADAVKFQTFTPGEIAIDIPILTGHDSAHDSWAKRHNISTLHQLFSKGGLPREWHRELKGLASKLGITFLSTPFSVDAAKFLVEEISVPALKIASGDLTFHPLMQYAVSTGLPLLVSTGGAYFAEITNLVLHDGTLNNAYRDERLAVLHCASIYPCPRNLANLRAIQSMRNIFPRMVMGWSDHTRSNDIIPVLAVAMGATVIEKHLKVEGPSCGIDEDHSLDVRKFTKMVRCIRAAPAILGDGVKVPQDGEGHDRLWARRSSLDWLRPTEEARQGAWE